MAQTAERRTRAGAGKVDVAPVIAATRHGAVAAVEAATGARLWQWIAEPRLGMLAHGGDAVYVVTATPLPIGRVEGQEGPPSWLAMAAGQRPARQLHTFPTTLTALRARDGAVLWQRDGWHPFGRGCVILDGDVLVTDALASGIGQSAVTALDPETGEERWKYGAGTQWGPVQLLLAAAGGRMLVREEGEKRRLCALDGNSGAEQWSREEPNAVHRLSDGGAYLAYSDQARAVEVLDVRDGSVAAILPLATSLLALTDAGIAYCSAGTYRQQQIAALRVRDGSELWRVDAEHPLRLLISGDRLYCTRLTEPKPRAEVTVLDTRTGQRLWRWRSPAHLLGLLKLWGWRTPQVILAALAQARWSIRRARDSRDRGIISREVIRGQWRRPTQLVGTIQVAADRQAVYVGTSLGLFALRATDGHLLWHALPTYDLSCFAPVVSPQSEGH